MFLFSIRIHSEPKLEECKDILERFCDQGYDPLASGKTASVSSMERYDTIDTSILTSNVINILRSRKKN